MSETAPAGYEFRDDIAIADAAFRAWAPDLEELFRQCATALTAEMVEEPSSVRRRERRRIRLDGAEDAGMLLFDFLGEIVFYKDAEEMLLLPESLSIGNRDGWLSLRATMAGEPIDRVRHPLGADVKAVTMHRFDVRRTEAGYEAEVVLDI